MSLHFGCLSRNKPNSRRTFKGLGADLVGVVLARSMSFYVYGNGKIPMAEYWNGGREATTSESAMWGR